MRRIWLALGAVIVASFAVLGWVGVRIYQMAPPVPRAVVTEAGRVVVAPGEVEAGQEVWRALGGQEVGSVWGHGAYVAPDWSADWLHRELVSVLDEHAQREFGLPYDRLDAERAAALRARVRDEYRRNTYDPRTGALTISEARARAYARNADHYASVFSEGRDAYAIPRGAVTDPARLRALGAFFFWTAWAAAAQRPGDRVTYTSNWPHEPLIGNVPSPDAVVWTGVSIILLLAGVGAMALWHATRRKEEPPGALPAADPLLGSAPTPSQRATVKYFWVVCALFVVQILLGVVSAHYGVEGGGFYGIPLAEVLPYSVARTWHTQLGIFWIATAWLGAGLAIAPSVGGEPRLQRLGVNALFGALLLVVVGSMAGQWVSVKRGLSGDAWFYFGHNGYEYIDLGRAFQVALFVGLVLWVALVTRAVWPALRRDEAQRPLIALFLLSTVAIGGFYAAAFGAGRHTNLAVAEYWRWWVVHLWVEGFFEVFATVVIAFLFARLGLVHPRSAARAGALSATVFLGGGIIGTLHHLYFSGTPTAVLALGAVFSALEVVPLLFVGYEAWDNLRATRATPWMRAYAWPIYFFVAVAFWNLVGAGLFGFMINPPVALFYMQGLNTTPVHGHAALFGVYGMLGLGLVLFTLRSVRPGVALPGRLLAFSFWAINGGLLAMVLLSLLPVGLLQTWASVEVGYWYARSPEFLQTPVMNALRWMRVVGDTAFALGALAFVAAVVRATAWPAPPEAAPADVAPPVAPAPAE
ncbi:MAG: nitric-oxide reductase large subunit [Polyangiales bacterium]